MKIISWNCQGLKLSEGVSALVGNKNPDILTLQECGNLNGTSIEFDSIKPVNSLVLGKWRDYNVFYYPWRDSSRCSMATFIKKGLEWKNPYCHIDIVSDSDVRSTDAIEDKSEEGDDLRKGLRAAVCVDVKYEDYNYLICNVHLPSGRPSFARKVGYKYMEILSYCPCMIMVGDFNTEPDYWQSLKSMLKVVKSRMATHDSGSELDYMITNIHYRVYASVLDSRGSDHCPVMFEF